MQVRLLKAEFVKAGLTQKQVAKAIGMSEATMIRRLKKGVFGTDEAEKITNFLKIEDPSSVFLTTK